MQVNKNNLSNLQQKSCFSCTVCATANNKRRQNQTNTNHFYSAIIITF